MKKVILSAFALTCAASVFAQGTVSFNNRVTGTLITYVYAPNPADPSTVRTGAGSADTPSGTTDWTGFTRIGASGTGGQYGASTTLSTLLGAPGLNQDPNSLQPATTTTTFRTGGAAGNVVATTLTFNNIPKDAPSGTFQMVAWDNTSGNFPTWQSVLAALGTPSPSDDPVFGKSNPFNLTGIGGDFNTPPNPIGLTSFSLAAIPEPSSFALAGLGTAALLIFRRRKN